MVFTNVECSVNVLTLSDKMTTQITFFKGVEWFRSTC